MGNAAITLSAIRQLIEEVPSEVLSNREVFFKRRGVQPPGSLYITQADYLAVSILPAAANPAIAVVARVLRADGEISYHYETITAAGAGVVTKEIFGLSEGFLLDVCVSAIGSSIQVGACFVRVDLQQGQQSGQAPFQSLTSGYVTNTACVAWPLGTPQSSRAGPGQLVTVVVAAPAAGAQVSYLIPSGRTWRLQLVYSNLSTSATVANRTYTLYIDLPGGNVFGVAAAFVIAANDSEDYYAGPGLPLSPTELAESTMPLPIDLFLPAGTKIYTGVKSMQAADQLNGLTILAEQWMEL